MKNYAVLDEFSKEIILHATRDFGSLNITKDVKRLQVQKWWRKRTKRCLFSQRLEG